MKSILKNNAARIQIRKDEWDPIQKKIVHIQNTTTEYIE
jgi:hypothetical protein